MCTWYIGMWGVNNAHPLDQGVNQIADECISPYVGPGRRTTGRGDCPQECR